MLNTIMDFIADYKIAEVAIFGIGIYGFALIVDRIKVLYFDFTLPTGPFMQTLMDLLNADKVDEAITFCAANKDKPLAYVIKRVLERSDREHSAVEKSYDIAASEVAPKLVKNLSHLPMIANVATMVGLFGTVVGLVMAFKALSFADPAQKQMLLTQGIAMAMTATAAGLAVSIPIMFIYSFLYSRQNKLFAEIDQNAMRVIELLSDRGYRVEMNQVYPSLASEKMTAAPDAPKKKMAN
jgi:biopolymer transport protein ExbB